MATKREFRSQESFDAEAVTRGMVAAFLESRGFTGVSDGRKSFGKTEQQIVHARSPTGDRVAMHVRLCWNREPGNQRQQRYSAVQLLSKIQGDDWIGSLDAKVERDRAKGVTHTLIVQREGDRLTDVVLIPIDRLVGAWDAQRALSAELIETGRFDRKSRNHAMNGSSPTLWLHDENAPEIRAMLLQWPGVIDLVNSPATGLELSGAAPDLSSDDYVLAMRSAALDERQQQWLVTHAANPDGRATMRQLSAAVGHSDWRTANVVYGGIAGRIARHLPYPPSHIRTVRKPQNMAWIARHQGKAEDGESVWELLPQAREALQAARVRGVPEGAPRSRSPIGGREDMAGKAASSPEYIARLAYNSQRWWRPTRAGEVRESADSYRSQFGFGHEDWLFRNDWLLDGWRYGFVQGVNKSRKKLLREGRSFGLRLFTMPMPGDRRAVARIREVECLTDELATEAVAAYESLGWLNAMRSEVAASGGRAEALDKQEFAPFILNLRYRLDSVSWLDADRPLPADDPIHNIKRYSLCEVGGAMDTAVPAWRGRAGNADLPVPAERKRFVQGGWTAFSPEHVRMQNLLVQQLHDRYPGADITCESDFVDVTVRTDDEILLYEVKSDLRPLSVIRQALGQVLEYALHPRRTYELPVQVVIVGRRPLEADDLDYFERLKRQIALPLTYLVVSI